MALLSVNIDHVATVRQARYRQAAHYGEPDVARIVSDVEIAGADGITVHLREDRRHVTDRDVEALRGLVRVKFNLEMAATDEMLAIAERFRPSNCCLVPEKRAELTTEGGLDVAGQSARMREVCTRLAEAGIVVSLFIDAEPAQIEAAAAAGAPAIELHTGTYADARDPRARAPELARLVAGAERAAGLGLQVNAGHGLNYHNVQEIARIEPLVELNIGHSIVAHAVFVGFERAVREMKRLMEAHRP